MISLIFFATTTPRSPSPQSVEEWEVGVARVRREAEDPARGPWGGVAALDALDGLDVVGVGGAVEQGGEVLAVDEGKAGLGADVAAEALGTGVVETDDEVVAVDEVEELGHDSGVEAGRLMSRKSSKRMTPEEGSETRIPFTGSHTKSSS